MDHRGRNIWMIHLERIEFLKYKCYWKFFLFTRNTMNFFKNSHNSGVEMKGFMEDNDIF